MDIAEIIQTALAVFIPLFVAMDPIATVPLIITWTSGLSKKERDQQLRDAVLTALALGLIFLFGGQPLLAILTITIADFLIAGGLILLTFAISDLLRGGGHEALGSLRRPDFGVVPIGTPLLAGPATLATLIVQAERFGYVLTAISLSVNLLIAWTLFRHAGFVTQLFGENGLRAASKVMSLLLAAIAIKFIREGLMIIIQ